MSDDDGNMNDLIKFCMVDIETTGLSAEEDVPLEIGLMLIDIEGNEYGSISMVVAEDTEHYRKAMDRMDANDGFVRDMHTKSGLLADIAAGLGGTEGPRISPASRAEADSVCVSWLQSRHIKAFTLPMFGNSIGSLDRPFCIRHFPKLHAFLHYRNVDMSSFKEVLRHHDPDEFAKHKDLLDGKSNAKHRVYDDLEACRTEFKTYLRYFL